MHNVKSSSVNVQSCSVGFPHLLGLLFIGLRLGGVIDWPWAYVLLPLWGPLALALLVLVVAAVIGIIAAVATTPK